MTATCQLLINEYYYYELKAAVHARPGWLADSQELGLNASLARICLLMSHTLCLKTNDTDVARYNLNAHRPILVIFGRDVAERVCCQVVICYPTSPNYTVSPKKLCHPNPGYNFVNSWLICKILTMSRQTNVHLCFRPR